MSTEAETLRLLNKFLARSGQPRLPGLLPGIPRRARACGGAKILQMVDPTASVGLSIANISAAHGRRLAKILGTRATQDPDDSSRVMVPLGIVLTVFVRDFDNRRHPHLIDHEAERQMFENAVDVPMVVDTWCGEAGDLLPVAVQVECGKELVSV